MQPRSPKNLPQDNAFPTFPTQQAKSRPKAGSIDEAMALMNMGPEVEAQGQGQAQGHGRPMGPPQGRGRGGHFPPQARGSPMGRGGEPDMQRHDSGHHENGRGPRPPPQRMGSSGSMPAPHQHFGPNTQRSVTMPQNMPGPASQRGYDAQQQWAEPSQTAEYHGPASPTYVPPRPSTAGGTRHNGQGPPQRFEQRPPIPQMPPPQQQQYQYQPRMSQDDTGALDNVYGDYYETDRRSQASIEMPNFDAIQEPSSRHRRGDSIDGHLSPAAINPPMNNMSLNGGPGNSQRNFYQQASRSRSQPDLNAQYSQGNGAYEMAADAPSLPPMPTAHAVPNGLPSGPRGRGAPVRGMTMDSSSVRSPANFDPRYGAHLGGNPGALQRGYSDDTTYSEPPNAMRNASPMVPGNPIARPGTAAPAPGRMRNDPMGRRPGTSNPDALPAHPAPIRPGLMQKNQPQSPQAARPPPVRQYHIEPAPSAYNNQPAGSIPPKRPVSASSPVTHDELNRMRHHLKNTPGDDKLGLQLAKKLVEAASVLADENGKADTRTRNKNREKFIMEAHKIIKKLVGSGSSAAMFYLADCYGQGLLGLQVDTKEAFTLYQSAAKAGHAASAYRTAVCCEMGHEEGGGTKRDPIKAVQWYKRAAALGDTPAMYKVGMILLKGLLGQQRNLGEAINMLKRAADHADEDNPHALHELALIYEAQTGNERIIRDEAYAYELLCQAAQLGYKFSQFRLGQAYEYGLLDCPIDARSSIAWYTKAAAKEEHQSELALSGWYLTGTSGILEQSDTEAYLWARKAACAEPPLPKALFAMGYFTEVGIGCPRSLDEAKRWYGRAAGKILPHPRFKQMANVDVAYKFPKAQERLEELKRGGAKVQMKRERLSRSNQKQQEENCTVM
jgi:TPR repeat protein